MGHESSSFSPTFSIDVAAQSSPVPPNMAVPTADANLAIVTLLRQMVQAQDRQNKLLEQVISANQAIQKQRVTELQQWREANPYLAKSCRRGAEALSRIQASFISQITDEIGEHEESLADGEFVLTEFVDRFGPRLAHLNGILQVMAQLSGGTSEE